MNGCKRSDEATHHQTIHRNTLEATGEQQEIIRTTNGDGQEGVVTVLESQYHPSTAFFVCAPTVVNRLVPFCMSMVALAVQGADRPTTRRRRRWRTPIGNIRIERFILTIAALIFIVQGGGCFWRSTDNVFVTAFRISTQHHGRNIKVPYLAPEARQRRSSSPQLLPLVSVTSRLVHPTPSPHKTLRKSCSFLSSSSSNSDGSSSSWRRRIVNFLTKQQDLPQTRQARLSNGSPLVEWIPTWLTCLRTSVQVLAALVLYIFHTLVLAQHAIPFPFQLIPNERGNFQSIGLDS
jgi:hypothetical protein